MSAATLDNVAKLYVATFNRAPDSAGLNYWATTSGLSLEDIAQSFFDQPETQTTYPSGTSTTAFVTSVYQNLFNRAPDQAGLDYWAHELDSHSVSNQNFILAVINGAEAPTGDPTDAAILQNKATVGLSFANAGLEDVGLARSVMAHVDETQTSVDDADNVITQNAPSSSSSYNFNYMFTTAELAGHTFYEVYASGDDNGHSWIPGVPASASTLDSISTIVFNANGTATETDSRSPGETITAHWSVDGEGVITFVVPDGDEYCQAIAESTTQNLILMDSSNYRGSLHNFVAENPDTWGYSYYTTDQTLAQSLLGQPSVINAETTNYQDPNLYTYNGSAIVDPVHTDQVWLNIA